MSVLTTAIPFSIKGLIEWGGFNVRMQEDTQRRQREMRQREIWEKKRRELEALQLKVHEVFERNEEEVIQEGHFYNNPFRYPIALRMIAKKMNLLFLTIESFFVLNITEDVKKGQALLRNAIEDWNMEIFSIAEQQEMILIKQQKRLQEIQKIWTATLSKPDVPIITPLIEELNTYNIELTNKIQESENYRRQAEHLIEIRRAVLPLLIEEVVEKFKQGYYDAQREKLSKITDEAERIANSIVYYGEDLKDGIKRIAALQFALEKEPEKIDSSIRVIGEINALVQESFTKDSAFFMIMESKIKQNSLTLPSVYLESVQSAIAESRTERGMWRKDYSLKNNGQYAQEDKNLIAHEGESLIELKRIYENAWQGLQESAQAYQLARKDPPPTPIELKQHEKTIDDVCKKLIRNKDEETQTQRQYQNGVSLKPKPRPCGTIKLLLENL